VFSYVYNPILIKADFRGSATKNIKILGSMSVHPLLVVDFVCAILDTISLLHENGGRRDSTRGKTTPSFPNCELAREILETLDLPLETGEESCDTSWAASALRRVPWNMANLNLFDHYALRARLQPALITLLPLALGVFAWSEPGGRWMTTLWTVLGTSGATYLVAIIARNRGEAIEGGLWDSWGGSPTTQLLRHSGSANPILREFWHDSLAKFLKRALPSAGDEIADPKAADALYGAVTRLLINERRDTKKHPLVYKENVNYGFSRNLFAMRPIGIAVSTAGLVASAAASRYAPTSSGEIQILPYVSSAACLLLLLCWLFVVRADWVKVAAVAYAERLLESSGKQAAKRRTAVQRGTPPGQ
jgi:hypothetical protein